MKKYTFPYYISYGRMDNDSEEIDVELSEKNAKRLEKSALIGGRFRLDEDFDISDIYNQVYKAIIAEQRKILMEHPSVVEDALSSDEDYDPTKPITKKIVTEYLESLGIGINYPENLQFLERTSPKHIKQSSYESVIIDQSVAADYVCDKKNANKIVYVDEGMTLYYVPRDYSGVFVVNSGVRKIEWFCLSEHQKITEVIIENGIEELSDSLFARCTLLTRVTIPASVKALPFNCFLDCDHLNTLVLSDGLLEINNAAFRCTTNLKELRIPTTVKSIDNDLISCMNSSGLTDLFFEGDKTRITDKLKSGWAWWRNVKIHARQNSEAAKCARKNRLIFVDYEDA